MQVKPRLPTYVAPGYRDDRLKPSKSEERLKVRNQRQPGSRNAANTSSTAKIDDDMTKRKVRRGHFQIDEIDSCEVTLDTIKNKVTYPAKTMSAISSSVKEIGYWCSK